MRNQPYAPKVGASSEVWNKKRKNLYEDNRKILSNICDFIVKGREYFLHESSAGMYKRLTGENV
jgi:hypothetical protein